MISENSEAIRAVANGFYQWNYWPNQHPSQVVISIDQVQVTTIFMKPPQRDGSYSTPLHFTRIYVSSDSESVKNTFLSSIHKADASGRSILKFPELWVFRNNPNLSPMDQFHLLFFPDTSKMQEQLRIDSEACQSCASTSCTIS